MYDIFSPYSIARYAELITRIPGFPSAIISPDVEYPHTKKNKQIYLPVPDPKWKYGSPQFIEYLYKAVHEAYHHTGEGARDFEILEKEKPGKLLFFCWNLLLDHNKENENRGVYIGRDQVVSEGRALFVKPQLDKMEDDSTTWQNNVGMALYLFDTYVRTLWMDNINPVWVQEVRDRAPIINRIFEKIEPFMERWYEFKSPEGVLELAKDILKELGIKEHKKGDPEPGEENQEFGSGDGEGKQDSPRGKSGEEKGEGDGEGDGEAEDGEDEGDKRSGGKTTINYEDLLQHSHDKEDMEKEDNWKGGDLVINYDNWESFSGYIPDEKPDIIYPSADRSFPAAESVMSTTQLHNIMRKRLLTLTQTRRLHNQKSGKLSLRSQNNAIVKRGTEMENAVFRKTTSEYKLDAAVTILVDHSGSMMGSNRYIHASAACAMLNEAISRINIPLEILGFTDDYDDNQRSKFYVHKEFNERISTHDLLGKQRNAYDDAEGNPDGEAIDWAHTRLLPRKEQKKLLIVVSDGQPAGNRSGDIFGYTKKVIETIERRSPINIIGIGLMTNSVDKLYSKHINIDQASQLEAALVKLVEENLF